MTQSTNTAEERSSATVETGEHTQAAQSTENVTETPSEVDSAQKVDNISEQSDASTEPEAEVQKDYDVGEPGSFVDIAAWDFSSNPFLGYPSLDEAIADCKGSSQVEAFYRMVMRENVFISGRAGSGKSWVLQPFEKFMARYVPDAFIVKAAPTGMAARNIDGITLHSLFGFRPNLNYKKELESGQLASFPKQGSLETIRKMTTLVIDEVSMVTPKLFTLMDSRLRKLKNNDAPFGGVQMILLGDFVQLPPIPDREDRSLGFDFKHCFDTVNWEDTDISLCFMDKMRRSDGDVELQEVLKEMSVNALSDDSIESIQQRCGESMIEENKSYSKLYTTNKKAEAENKRCLDAMPGQSFYLTNSQSAPFLRYDDQSITNAYQEWVKVNEVEVAREYKNGATIIITDNCYSDEGEYLPNGTIAKVACDGPLFDSIGSYLNIEITGGRIVTLRQISREFKAYVENVFFEKNARGENVKKRAKSEQTLSSWMVWPMKLGFAITVHKSQGQTYDGVICDLSQAFMPGLGYVAISRVRTLKDLVITGYNRESFAVDKESSLINRFVMKKAVKNRKDFMTNYRDDVMKIVSYPESVKDDYWANLPHHE